MFFQNDIVKSTAKLFQNPTYQEAHKRRSYLHKSYFKKQIRK